MGQYPSHCSFNMEAYFLVVLLASVVSGRYADPVSHTVAVQKVGLVPSMREVLVSGHMGPAYVAPLPGYGYAAQQAPSIAHHVPLHQPLVGHATIISAPAQHHQPLNHHAVAQHHQPLNHHAVVQHHQPLNHHAVVQHHQPLIHHTPVEKSTKTHKTSYHVSSRPVEHKRHGDSAYTFTSSHNHEDDDDYVQEEMHDTPAIHHNSMMQQFPSHHSPVMARVSASNRGQIMQGHNVPV